MKGSRSATHHSSAEVPIRSDLAKMDAHVITPEEYDEIPELTDAMVARADFYIGDRLVRRDPLDSMGGPVVIGLLPEVVAHFRAQGPGWQTRINAVLMEAIERERAEKPR